jgi:hypothetical protein
LKSRKKGRREAEDKKGGVGLRQPFSRWSPCSHEIRNEIQAGNKRGNDMFMKEKNGKVPWEEEIKS